MHLSYRHSVDCALCMLLFLTAGFPAAPSPQTQPPASILNKAQQAELEGLNQKTTEAYDKGDLKTAEKLAQEGLDKASATKATAYVGRFLEHLGLIYDQRADQWPKALNYFQRALGIIESTGTQSEIAQAVANEGYVLFQTNEYAKSILVYQRALKIRERLGDQAVVAETLTKMGWVYWASENWEKALEVHERALKIEEKLGDRRAVGFSLSEIGTVYGSSGDSKKQVEYYKRALNIYEAIKDQKAIAHMLSDIGSAYSEQGDKQKALEYYENSSKIADSLGDTWRIALLLQVMGPVYLELEQNEKALDCYQRLLKIQEAGGDQKEIADTLSKLSKIYEASGQMDKAQEYRERAEKIGKTTPGSSDPPAEKSEPEQAIDLLQQYLRAKEAYEKHDEKTAEQLYLQGLQQATVLRNADSMNLYLNALGDLYLSSGQKEKAYDFYERWLKYKETNGTKEEFAAAIDHLAGVYMEHSQNEQALTLYEKELSLRESLGNKDELTACLVNLGVTYRLFGQIDKSNELYKRALEIRKTIGDQDDKGIAPDKILDARNHKPYISRLRPVQKASLDALLARVGKVLKNRDIDAAEQLLGRGLATATEWNDALYKARFLNAIGTLYNALSQSDKALDYLQRSLAIHESIGDMHATVQNLSSLADTYSTMGKDEQAVAYYRRALRISEASGNKGDIAHSLNNLGVAFLELDQEDRAHDLFERALRVIEALGKQDQIAQMLETLGLVEVKSGRFEAARTWFQRELEISQKIGNRKQTGATLAALATVYEGMRQNEIALDCWYRTLAFVDQSENKALATFGLHKLALAYAAVGQFQKSLEFLQRALTIAEQVDDKLEIGSLLDDLGFIYSRFGQYENALSACQRALQVREKIGNQRNIADALGALGSVYSDLGQYDRALENHLRALKIREELEHLDAISGPSPDTAGTLNDVGVVYGALGQKEKALDFLQRAVKRVPDSTVILSSLGDAYTDLGRFEEAEQQFKKARQLYEARILQVSDPAQVGAFQELHPHLYERMARLALAQKRPDEALEVLEAGRARGLRRLLAINLSGGLSRYLSPTERHDFNAITQEINAASSLRQTAQKRLFLCNPEQKAQFSAKLALSEARYQNAEQEYTRQYEQLFRAHPELQQLGSDPIKVSQLRQLAHDHPDTLYLEWGVVNNQNTLLFAYGDKDGLRSFSLNIGERALRTLTQEWRASLEMSQGRGAQNVNQDVRRKAKSDEVLLAQQAYTTLLGDADKAGLLAGGSYKRLVLVTTGPMLEMPLEALCIPSGQRLIERFAVSHAISLSLFFTRTNSHIPKGSLLCIADPTGNAQKARAGDAAKTAPVDKGGLHRSQIVSNVSPFRSGFAPLPGARSEGKAVASQFEGSRLVLGSDAREEVVTKLLPDYSILHFATHGYILPNTIMDSGLVLSEEQDEVPDTASNRILKSRPQISYDGLLTARKIVNIPLSARLSVLSACETGLGNVSGGEGLVGLAWAFRAAGCPSLVASLWCVDDVATKDWMLAFYTALKAGKPRDEAVQTAMLSVKQAHPSPYYWAAFQLIGDAGPLNPSGYNAPTHH